MSNFRKYLCVLGEHVWATVPQDVEEDSTRQTRLVQHCLNCGETHSIDIPPQRLQQLEDKWHLISQSRNSNCFWRSF